jgi:hypothetical protein
MNGSAENTAYDASEKPGRRDAPISLGVARRMLPLVRRVVDDLLQHQRLLARLLPEQARLDRQKRTLAWPARARRYQLREEVATSERYLQEARAELEVLGIELLDTDEGRMGFPTEVNGRAAYFSWRPGEETIAFWHYAGEAARRRIPVAWLRAAEESLAGQRCS